jgi:hypothetical protein
VLDPNQEFYAPPELPRIASTACFDRGVMEHSKGSGVLYFNLINFLLENYAHQPYEIISGEYSYEGSISFPLSSRAFLMSRVDSMDAIVIQRDAEAMCFPGQILVFFALNKSAGVKEVS